MKWLPVLCYLGVAVWQVAVHFDDFFPKDQATRKALNSCSLADAKFDARRSEAREACLKQAAGPAPASHQWKFVDARAGERR
jgi:hypothetical protein